MSKLKLTDVEWGEFKIGNIFEIARGKRHIEKNRKKGSIPYYSASSVNNGVTDFISNPLFVMGNKIIVTTFCDAFYAGNTFTASDEITILDNKYVNKHNGLFISNSIMSNKSKYAFGRKAFTERIKEQIIMLPIDSQGQPNWQFMEDYIKQEQKQQAQKIIDYYERKLVKLAGDVVGLDKVEWKEFSVGELFDIKIGKNIDGNKVDRVNGETAYITRKENTNGLDGFVDYDSEFLNSIYPVITIGNETAEPYVQEFPFFTGTKVNILLPKFKMETAILKYIATSLRQHKSKYSYSFTINSTRLKKQNILLPADKNGNPDFRYMSDFVKKFELDKVQEVLEYIYIYISN